MAETFEELYHRVSSDPTAGSVTEYLQEATERLSIEEELAMATATEVSGSGEADEFLQKRLAAVAAKARERQGN